MKKIFLSAIILLLSISYSIAQKQTLRFDKDGKFKIVQFTDVHYIHGNPKSDIAVERINEVLDNEKPNLVIFTGDVIFGKPAEEGYRTIMNLVSKRNIPFAVTFGNHDDESGLSRRQLMDILYTIPGNLTDTTENLSGVSNFVLSVMSADGKKEERIIYCLDSNSYCEVPGIKGYDYIKYDQIDWYRKQSEEIRKRNNNDTIPALAFFHIPLPEFKEAASDEGVKLVGTRMEGVCSPTVNSGMFVAMKEMGDVNGVFVGHDHNNDYALWFNDIVLAYGRYTGGSTVYGDLPNGARVIVLTEGDKGFESYIVTAGGEVSNRISYTNK